MSSKSKMLALVLRHKPEKLDLTLSYEGYIHVNKLIENWNKIHTEGLSLKELHKLVEDDDKKRYHIEEVEGVEFIRANQGHSLDHINIDYDKKIPPLHLYHGTKDQFMSSIEKFGLSPKNRNHVHLSGDERTAETVANRRSGKSVMLKINAKQMSNEGHKFYLSANHVWLVDEVPIKYYVVIKTWG